MQVTHKQFFFKILFFSFIINILTAYYSVGYYHSDEHNQVIEFMNYKLGNVPKEKLPWEFFAQIRPWLQPAFYFISYKFIVSIFLNINPFSIATLFRIESSILMWVAQSLFIYALYNYQYNKNNPLVARKWKLSSIIISFFWLFPFLGARTSAENLSHSFMLFSISFFLLTVIRQKSSQIYAQSTVASPNDVKTQFFDYNRLFQKLNYSFLNSFIFGGLLGICFEFRYQSAFFALGLGIWIFLNIANRIKFTSAVFLGSTFILILGVLIDRWGYGNYKLTAFRYFFYNIVQGAAQNYGTTPWYGYIPFVFDSLDPQFGFIFIVFYFMALIKYPKNIFIWSSFIFIFAHSIVAHKEMRFLFPILSIASIPMTEAIIDFLTAFYNKHRKIILLIVVILAICNIAEIIRNMVRPPTKFIKSLYYLQNKLPSDTYYGFHVDLQCDLNQEEKGIYCGFPRYFYIIKLKKFVHLNSLEEFQSIVFKSSMPLYINLSEKGLNFLHNPFYAKYCKVVYSDSLLPNFILHQKNDFLDSLLKRSRTNLFMKCSKEFKS